MIMIDESNHLSPPPSDSPKWINDGPMPIDCNGGQREYRDIYTQSLDEGAEAAHEPRQVPTLQQGSLELHGMKILQLLV